MQVFAYWITREIYSPYENHMEKSSCLLSTVQSTSIPQNPRATVDQISATLRGPREKVGVFDVKVGTFDVTIPWILKSTVLHGVMQCVHGVIQCVHGVSRCDAVYPRCDAVCPPICPQSNAVCPRSDAVYPRCVHGVMQCVHGVMPCNHGVSTVWCRVS